MTWPTMHEYWTIEEREVPSGLTWYTPDRWGGQSDLVEWGGFEAAPGDGSRYKRKIDQSLPGREWSYYRHADTCEHPSH